MLDRKLERALTPNKTGGLSVLSIGVIDAIQERLVLRFEEASTDEVLDIHR
ncbi:MAG: hypothetical protein Q8N04_01060 [Nitrospira sp.]|nr:hypothetical protein [Nitrospira sp.]